MWKPSQCSRKMHPKGFHRMFILSILLAFSCCVFSTAEYTCPFDIHVNKGQIIKARESVNNGASFLKHAAVLDAKECYRLCCERKNCDLAQMQYRNSTVGYFPQVEKICYMFHCGKPTKCRFGEHDHYATIVYDRPDEELSRLDSNQFGNPSVKDTKPKWNSEHAQEAKSKPSVPEGTEEETDLGHDSFKPSVTQHVKEQAQHQESKDLSSTSKQKSVDKMSEYEKKLKEFVQPQYHNKDTQEPKKTIWEEEEYFKPKETEPPQYQEVTKNEKPTKHVQIETKGPIVPVVKVTEKQKEVYIPPTQQDLDDADAELERKLEELTPSNNHQAQPAAQVVPTRATTTFHHWREFVDNNPNYPYTIPVEVEKPTMKPTTEKWREPITERKTTKKLTTIIKQQVRTEQPKVTEKTKATEKEPAPKVQDNTHDQVAHTIKAPILEVPIKNKNVSDVVVIETQRLRIIENKAVLPLAIFLILAILLLFVVALRLRIVKSKLKRRPFATDDADYLINGMYL